MFALKPKEKKSVAPPIKCFNRNLEGFTLLGVIVSLFLVTLGIMGFATLFRAFEAAAISNKNELAAGFLAQEGLEIVRRNREASSKTDWSAWYANLSDGDYNVTYSDYDLESFSNVPLKLDPSTLAYNYNIGSDTIFYRKITLQKVDADTVVVTCVVDWNFKGNAHQLILQDQFYDWR